jgi:tetratricopeptide (TPR) repeat protein
LNAGGGRNIGRFVVDREVGRGGMGVVYAATDPEDGSKVAVKVLSAGMASTDAIARFQREIAALGSLDHPHIVRYRGHGVSENGAPFLAMDWIDGEDLEARLERGPLPIAEALALGAALSRALAAVHAQSMVHRDLKPSNVLLPGGDVTRPIIVDFGIARSAHVRRMTRTGAVLGTPQYMAPEQVQGSSAIDARTDLFALGLILHECLTGRPVFEGEHVMAILAKVLVERAPSLAAAGLPAPSALETLLASLLEKSPPLRPSSAKEVALALENCVVDDRTIAAPPPMRETERRLVAVVLASDVQTSIGLDQTITPEEATALTATLNVTIREHGGELHSLGENRFLVVFSATGVATDQARRAARCALAMSVAWPSARIALALGWAEIGALPAGEVIDRAAALLEAESATRVRADDATAALLEVHFQTTSRGTIHEVLAERRVEERPRTLLGKPTRFVGRERELGTLLASLDEVVEEGVARAVLVTGVSGAGKSRLRHETLARVRARDAPIAILETRAEDLRSGSPLDAVAGLVRAWARDEPLQARIDQRFPPEERADLREFLGELIGLPSTAEPSTRLAAARLDARLMGEHMLRAFVAMLRAESAVHPLLILVEDLHWADPQSVRFLDVALRDLAERPWLLIGFARPDVHERFPSIWKARGVSDLALGPLTRRSSERLVTEVLGEVDPALVERIVKHADGNALYLEELIRAASAGSLESLPSSVLAMLQARLEALEPSMRRALRAASVFGESFERAAVHRLAADGAAELERLVEAEVLLRAGHDERFAFRHAAVRDAAYAMLSEHERDTLHGLAAQWLIETGEPDARLIAGHHHRAGDAENARDWFARAARQAFEKTDFEAALELGALSIELGADGDTLAAARAARGCALSRMGRLVEAAAELTQALAVMSADADELRLTVLRELWIVGVFRQLATSIRRAGNEALSLAQRLRRPDIALEARCALAMAEHCDERCDRSVASFREAWAASGHRPNLIFGTTTIVLYHAGHYAEAEEVIRGMLARANDVHDHTTGVTLESNLGAILAGMGRYEEARAHFANARAVGTRVGLPMVTTRALSMSVGHHIDVLDFDGAHRLATETSEIGRQMEFATPRVSSTLDLAFVATARKDAATARAIVDRVQDDVAKGTGFHGWLWRARMLLLRAEIAVLDGAFVEALSLSEQAIANCTRLRREKYVAVAECSRAAALVGLGRADEAVRGLSGFLHERLTLPDPALRFRLATALLRITNDESARIIAGEAAAAVERGLPAAARDAFRRAAYSFSGV